MPAVDMRMFVHERNVLRLSSVLGIRHTVDYGYLLDAPTRRWFCKEMLSPIRARLEVLASEFYRFIIPTQPVVRLGLYPQRNTHYVLSEEVPNYVSLPFHQQDSFTQGKYVGLGEIMVVSILLQEIDLKNSNIGLSGHRVVKIDGDWCFAGVHTPKYFGSRSCRITPGLLTKLPELTDFYAYNWLDLVKEEIKDKNSIIFDAKALAKSPCFREEVNRTILKILLLPEVCFEKMVDAYLPSGAAPYLDFFLQRREQLRLSAMKNESFGHYLGSTSAEKDMSECWAHVKSFETCRGYPLITAGDEPYIKNEFDKRYHELLLKKPNILRHHSLPARVDAFYKNHAFLLQCLQCMVLVMSVVAVLIFSLLFNSAMIGVVGLGLGGLGLAAYGFFAKKPETKRELVIENALKAPR